MVEYIDRFNIFQSVLDNSNESIYHINNDTLSTHSKIFLIHDMDEDFNELINSQEIYFNDIAIGEGSFFSESDENPYQVKLTLDLNDEGIIPDSLNNTIDFILDSIIVIPFDTDPSGDNAPSGTEGNNEFDDSDDVEELFSDLEDGFETCKEIYEKIQTYNLEKEVSLPKFNLPTSFSNQDDYLKSLTIEGAKKRYKVNDASG